MNRNFYICSGCGVWSAGLSRWLNGAQNCAACDDARELRERDRLRMVTELRPRPAVYEERLQAHRARRRNY